MDTPKYDQASLDPSILNLQEQSKKQDVDAFLTRVRAGETSAKARYGTLTPYDTASIIAGAGGSADVMTQYAALLALSESGQIAPINKKSPTFKVA